MYKKNCVLLRPCPLRSAFQVRLRPDPGQVVGEARVDVREAGLRTARAKGRDAGEDPAAVGEGAL